MLFKIKYKTPYKSKEKIPKRYFKNLSPFERKLMEKEILKRPMSLKFWSADKTYTKRIKSKIPKSSYTQVYIKKYGKENAGDLKKISKATKIPLSTLKEVYKRGIAAWTSGHRPGVYPNQWAMARVYSFVMCGKIAQTADSDLWEKLQARKNPKNLTFNEIVDYIKTNPNLQNLKILGSESEGTAFYFRILRNTYIFDYLIKPGEYVIKIYYRPKLLLVAQEYLIKLSKYGLIPKIYYIDSNVIVMEYIDAIPINIFVEDVKYEKNYPLIYEKLEKKVNNLINVWRKLGFKHGDIRDPSKKNWTLSPNILVSYKNNNLKVYFIDPNIRHLIGESPWL